MTYTDVTLAPDDIEWDRPKRTPSALKSAIFDDELFTAFVEEHGVQVALEKVTEFHRAVSNQLIGRGVRETKPGTWAARTVHLSRSIKRRRNELRRWLRARVEGDEYLRILDMLDGMFPRAEWESAVVKPAAPVAHPALVRQPRRISHAEEREEQQREISTRSLRVLIERNGIRPEPIKEPSPHSCARCRNPYTVGNPACVNAPREANE